LLILASLVGVGVTVYWPESARHGLKTVAASLGRHAPPPVPVPDIAAPGRDTLSASPTLRAVYEADVRALDPAERSLAWHAWSVCVPTFMGADGGPRPLSALADGLPKDATQPARLAAMQALAGRCAAFFDRPRAQLLEDARLNAERHRAGDLRSRGELATTAVEAGNGSDALALIREITTRRSAYELRDLSGLVSRWHRDAPLPTDALRDAVLLVVGCDFGMDCSADSELALELCGFNGACSGDLVERSLLAFPDVDRSAVNAARVALAAELREGRFDAMRYFEPPSP
jgi:hypothetical protein